MTRQRFLATLIGLLLSGAVFASTPSEVVAWSGSVAYSYDGSGNIRQIGRDRFAYDVTSRLIQAEVNGIRRDYGYDAFGNRIDCTQARGTAEQSDCQQGRTISPANNRIVGVPHDAAGNVQSLNQHLYAYDAVNMVTRDTAGVQSREFIYTADDERIATHETPTGSWHWTARDPSGKVLREFTSTDGGSWQWVRDYVYRDDKLVASRHPAGGFVETYHYHLDHLGTPRRITNALDATVGFHDYHAFGPEVPGGANEPSLTPLKYTGHERDRWLGEGDDTLDYMHARYYSPGMGRFLSVDPVLDVKAAMAEPEVWNRYSYVTNNPLMFTDPDGRYRTFYGEKPMTAENLAMDENTPAVVKASVYAGGGLTALGAGGLFFAGGSGGGLAAGAFRLPPIARGNFIEAALAAAFGGGLPRTFPVIDRFLNGVATSVKSLDLGAKTYQNAQRLTSTLTGFVDKLAQFDGGRLGTFRVQGEAITHRVLEVVVQRGAASPQQTQAIQRAAAYASMT
jgi:RHS repeat-associated protein